MEMFSPLLQESFYWAKLELSMMRRQWNLYVAWRFFKFAWTFIWWAFVLERKCLAWRLRWIRWLLIIQRMKAVFVPSFLFLCICFFHPFSLCQSRRRTVWRRHYRALCLSSSNSWILYGSILSPWQEKVASWLLQQDILVLPHNWKGGVGRVPAELAGEEWRHRLLQCFN